MVKLDLMKTNIEVAFIVNTANIWNGVYEIISKSIISVDLITDANLSIKEHLDYAQEDA